MVYGLNETFEERLCGWREAGYRVHVMTGVAWGSYQDYVRGEWDGVPHYDDAQTAAGGFRLEHGIAQGHDVYYMMPSAAYARYLAQKLCRVVDAGALALHLEEPEFWVRGGYGEGFQREWAAFYGEPWQDPAFSPDARYRAAKLKQHLYTRTLAYLCRELKHYAQQVGLAEFRCYVPTHSLVNYAHWRIVSPESQLLAIPDCDGLIGQVWTGTARTPNVYRGIRKQRTFEAAYCEYAACVAIVRGTDKQLWQLADPIEDSPQYCWDDYRANWERTVVASLLVAESERFEIMPWPRRVFTRSYPTINLSPLPLQPLLDGYLKRLQAQGADELLADSRRAIAAFAEFYTEQGEESRRETLGFADLADRTEELRFGDVWGTIGGFYRHLSLWEDQEQAQRLRDAMAAFYRNATDQRSFIPQPYATELQIVFNALADMHWPADQEWIRGQMGIGLAISDTLMYQRGDPSPSDADMSSLYGLAMPLLKRGVALSMVQLERAADAGYLQDVDVLLVTYEGQKPPSAQVHRALADWVQQGHALLLFGMGDAYDSVREWWNEDGLVYARPQEHLTELLGLGRKPESGQHACGQGLVLIELSSPAELAHLSEGADVVLARVLEARQALGLPWSEGNVLALRRGPYVVAAGVDESDVGEPTDLPGTFVDLFDSRLTVRIDPKVLPDTCWLLYDLAHCPGYPWVIAAAGCVRDESWNGHALSFSVEGMIGTVCAVRVWIPSEPLYVQAGGEPTCYEWDAPSRTALVQFANRPTGCRIEIGW